MKNKIKILGFYRRKRDGNEYVLYEEDNRQRLTNGVFIWRNFINKRLLPQCEKVKGIDLNEISARLKKHYPYHPLIEELRVLPKE